MRSWVTWVVCVCVCISPCCSRGQQLHLCVPSRWSGSNPEQSRFCLDSHSGMRMCTSHCFRCHETCPKLRFDTMHSKMIWRLTYCVSRQLGINKERLYYHCEVIVTVVFPWVHQLSEFFLVFFTGSACFGHRSLVCGTPTYKAVMCKREEGDEVHVGYKCLLGCNSSFLIMQLTYRCTASQTSPRRGAIFVASKIWIRFTKVLGSWDREEGGGGRSIILAPFLAFVPSPVFDVVCIQWRSMGYLIIASVSLSHPQPQSHSPRLPPSAFIACSIAMKAEGVNQGWGCG